MDTIQLNSEGQPTRIAVTSNRVPMADRHKLDEIRKALEDNANDDQRRIASVGIGLVHTLLCKNADYGSSAFDAPLLCPKMEAGQGILVRMSDKIKRFITLTSKSASVTTETVADTIGDLAGYSILWLARPQGKSQDAPDSK